VACAGDNGAMGGQGSAVDRITQAWVRATGQQVMLDQYPWLDGPIGSPTVIGDEWLVREATDRGATLSDGGGLLDSFDALASAAFDPSRLSPTIVDFYEHTTDWRLDVWSQWSPAALPAGWLSSAVFAKRLQQLALPLRPLDVAHGMESRVVTVRSADGDQLGAAWRRTLRSTRQVVYSGWYGTAQLPEARTPSIRVVFPLPNGSVSVFLEPSVDHNGSLILTSPMSRFGDNGAYLIVRDANTAAVRRAPLAERFRVYVDDEGTLRADHFLNLWSIPTLRIHYRLERAPRASATNYH
jgi:hypothetical protein